MRLVLSVLCVIACGDTRTTTTSTRPEPTAPPVSQPDAGIGAHIVDAPPPVLELVHRCNAKMTVKGRTRVRIDAGTSKGAIDRFTSGAALTRNVHVTARRDRNTLVLVFDRYAPDDHSTIRGVKKPRPASEKLVKGESVVARLETVAPLTAHLHVDGAIDWTTDAYMSIEPGGYVMCNQLAPDEP